MRLTLGFSPCPNDTFIFDALLHGKIDTEGLTFDLQLADVEELNRRAFEGNLQITKLSYHAYAYLTEHYVLLDAGSALGNNCGPLLIAKKKLTEEEIFTSKIAIPGKYTTANFLLGLAYPQATHKYPYLFSDIEDAVLHGEMDAGLIIHENRFTYAEKGLVKLIDLGEYWENATSMPIPLGGIVIDRRLPRKVQETVNRVLGRSVAYALDHPQSAINFVRTHAQEMEEEVMYQHIHLYVNDFTRNLGEQGRAAVQLLFNKARQREVIPTTDQPLFL